MPKWMGYRDGKVPVAVATASMDSLEERAFFQERLGVFAMWSAVLGFAFYVVNLSLNRRDSKLNRASPMPP